MADSSHWDHSNLAHRVPELKSDGRAADYAHCVGDTAHLPSLKHSPKKLMPALVPLKLDYREFQPSEASRTNRNAHTPTEKINTFTVSPHYNAGTPPPTGEDKFFKAPQTSLKKITSEGRRADQPPDGFSRLLEEYFSQKSESSIGGSTQTLDQMRFASKQLSPTSLQQRADCLPRPSHYFAGEYPASHPLKEIKMPRSKEPSFTQDIMRKMPGNPSPTAATIQTCSTFQTLRYKKQEDAVPRSSVMVKSPQHQQSDRLKIGDFILIKELGYGKYGCVYLVRHRLTGFLAAIKVIKKMSVIENNLLKQLIRQLRIQAYLNHPNIVDMYGCFSDKENIYILMELAPEGQLYLKMKQKERYSEEAAAFIIKNLLSAIQYIHSKKLLHRDIKPQNIVVVHGTVKLCDFGWAVHCGNNLRSTFCGTPLYLSPEQILGRSYNEKADLWSIGILSYELVVGQMPFQIQDQRQLAKIVTQPIEFPKELDISQEFKDFVRSILRKDPKQRPSSEELMEHPFLEKYNGLETCEELCVD